MEEVLFFVILGAVPFIVAALRRRRTRQDLRKLIQMVPRTLAREIPSHRSIAAVQGHARASATVQSPFSGEACIGYQTTILFDPQDKDAGQQEVWLSRWAEFDVVDSSGAVRVRGEPVLLIAPVRVFSAPEVSDLMSSDVRRQLLQEEGVVLTDIETARDLRVEERVLRPGDKVYVLGAPSNEATAAGSTAGYRELPTRTVFTPYGDLPLIVADKHHDQLIGEFRHLVPVSMRGTTRQL